MKSHIIVTCLLFFFCCTGNANTDITSYQEICYTVYTGPSVYEHAHHWPPLSVELTYDYPYLYVGKAEEEDIEQFLTNRSVSVLAYADQRVIGIAIGTPTNSGKGNSSELLPLIEQDVHYSPESSLYIVEVLVDKAYQKRGIARAMMHLFEKAAGEMGYTDMYLITVERSAHHPFKTASAPDLDLIWQHLGFSKTSLSKPCLWPTRCGTPAQEYVAKIDNMVRLWHRSIKR